jgi:hypothetical protein
MEFYSAMRNNDIWFEVKWMQLEDIMLREVSQAQKDKGCMFSLIHGRQILKINICTKPSMFKLIIIFVTVDLLYGTQGRR